MLAVNSISLTAGNRKLLDEIKLTFLPGVLYGVLGPNGSGKTTLLKILSGIWQPTGGTVFWRDENLIAKDRQEISRIVSLVPQSPLVPFDFTAKEIVSMGRYPHGGTGKTPREIELIKDAMQQVDAYQLSGRKMSQLSVGERQRLYIARALVTESPVLLLDEPTASLDIKHELEIWAILERLLQQGKIVVAAIHNLQAARTYCHQVVALKEGRCMGVGSPAEILTPDLLYEIYGVRL